MTIRVTFLCAPGGDATVDPLLGDVPLSDLGLHRAAAAQAMLPPHELAVRAPSIRCSQTAAALGLEAAVEPALHDLGLGTWCGRTVDEVAAADPHGFAAWLKDPDAAPHEGESVRRLCRRTANWLGSMAPDTGHTVALTEAAVVRAALIHALGVPARAFWHLAVPPLSTVSLTLEGGCWDVRVDDVDAAPQDDRRWPHSRPAMLVHARSDQSASHRFGGGKRSGTPQEAAFAACR
ncbi:histidine phosphatase family protein [Streptomyces sp. NPDC048045]|uniref:histidine phosphatase family protein n=1 Tax=Streptomyces sp. NPDC048045 TaxID=3154710 RepID=UPI00343123D1